MSARTIATSRNACCAVDAATTTRRQTISTPIRSIAMTRSGNVGPRTSRTKVRTAATASTVSVSVNTRSNIAEVRSAEDVEHPALEAVLDLAARGLGRVDV